MLDIKLIREHPEAVRKNLEKRNDKEKLSWLHEVIDADKEWRKLNLEVERLRHSRNKISEEINQAKKQGKDISEIVQRAKVIPELIKEKEELAVKLKEKVDYILMRLPNILHEKVPIGKGPEDNKVIKRWGKPKKFLYELKTHTELAEDLGMADFEQGASVAGRGFNYLYRELALLDLALQRYGIDFLFKNKFTPVIPPMLLNRSTLSGAVDLSAFDEVIYKIEQEDLYLIGTAEHSLVSFNKGKVLKESDIPIRICAVTPCFRKEIGAHGVDTKGLFRMHQFNKVEQVVYTKPKDSFKMLEEMQGITERFFKSLKIPFRVVELCSGDLGGKFAKQYDIEAWFPRQNAYKEVTSAGNCTDYQARRLNITYIGSEGKGYVHILNNTMVATSRAMVAILENFQQKDGSVKIPRVLHKYMNGIKELRANINRNKVTIKKKIAAKRKKR